MTHLVTMAALLAPVSTALGAPEVSNFDRERFGYWRSTLDEEGIERLRDAARSQLQSRRLRVPEYDEKPRKPIPILDDIRENPIAYDDVPVVLWGRVTSVEEVPGDPDEDAIVTAVVNLHEDTDQPIRVFTAATDSPLKSGDPVIGIGYLFDFDAEDRLTFFAVKLDVLGDRLSKDVLSAVEHGTRQRPEERDAYFTSLVHARMADTSSLRRRAEEFREKRAKKFRFRKPEDFPTFVDLVKSYDKERHTCDLYHGRPVTLTGHVWSITKLPALNPSKGDEAEYGFEAVYQIQLYTTDSQTHAASIVCTELPEGLPSSGHLDERIDGITVTGFFYKMGTYYDQQRKGRIIPIIVARTVTWQPPPEPADLRIPSWAYWITGGGIAGLVAVIGWLTLRDRAGRDAARRRLEETEPPSFEEFTNRRPPGDEDFLQ